MQRCYSCGRETPFGEPLAHFYQCDVAGNPTQPQPGDSVMTGDGSREALNAKECAEKFVQMVGDEFGNAAGVRLRDVFAAMAGGLSDAQCDAIYQAVSMSNLTRDVKSPERKRQVVRDAARAAAQVTDAMVDSFWAAYIANGRGGGGVRFRDVRPLLTATLRPNASTETAP